jgi:hypothetical protein
MPRCPPAALWAPTVPASVASYTLIPAPTTLPPGAAEIKITTQLLIWPRRNAVSGGWEGGKISSNSAPEATNQQRFRKSERER